MKTLTVTLTVTLLLVFSVAWAEGTLKEFDGPAPPLELVDIEGVKHSLANHGEGVAMVQFWATYCTPCRTEMPSMNLLAEKLGDRFKILAVNMGESEKDVRGFVDEVKPQFTVLLDPNGKSIVDWKVFAVPSTFIVDRTKRIRYTLYGPTEWDSDEIVATITALLHE